MLPRSPAQRSKRTTTSHHRESPEDQYASYVFSGSQSYPQPIATFWEPPAVPTCRCKKDGKENAFDHQFDINPHVMPRYLPDLTPIDTRLDNKTDYIPLEELRRSRR